MTIDLGAIRARANEAIAGPWRVGDTTLTDDVDLWRLPIVTDRECEDGTETLEVCAVEYETGGFQYPHADARVDAEFVAHAWQDIPALLDEVERLRAELDAIGDMAYRAGPASWADALEAIQARAKRAAKGGEQS